MSSESSPNAPEPPPRKKRGPGKPFEEEITYSNAQQFENSYDLKNW